MTAILEPEKIERALEAREYTSIRRHFTEQVPREVADLIGNFEEDQRAVLFRLLPREYAAETFEHLEPDAQEGLIRALGTDRVSAILNDMSPDDRTALLEELPASVTRQALELLSPEERKIARKLLGYPEDSIGRLMTPDFIALKSDWTIAKSLQHVRRHGLDSETLNVIYVVDDAGKLIDDLRIRQVLLADPDARVSDIMDGHCVALKAMDDQETAIRVFTEYDRVGFPVTDSGGVLIGIVTVDDVLDVAEEEATEDIQKIGGMQALDQPYMQAGYREMLRKRAGWLVLLFLGQLLTINAIGRFSANLEKAIVLTLFLPLIISSGGNSGSQAATLVVRAMALEELSMKDWWKVMRREIFFGVTVGAVLAGLGLLRIMIDPQIKNYPNDWGLVAIVVGTSLMGTVLFGVMIGSMLPFLLRRLGADPAASSTPFVATIADIAGLMIYFTIASVVLF